MLQSKRNIQLKVLQVGKQAHAGVIVSKSGNVVDGGRFFLTCKDFGRMFDNSFPACAFFLKWRLAHAN